MNDTEEYCARYNDYDFKARFGQLLEVMDFPRVIILLEFERLITKHYISATNVLMLNGGATGDPELDCLTYERVDVADYEADPTRYDLHAPRFERSDYDFVFLSQTLEHLYDPSLALEQLFGAMAPGGYLWASNPTVARQHQLPQHFATGFTPTGMACLFAHSGFDVVEIGQWGNSTYIDQTFALGLFPTYYDLVPLRWRGVRHLLWTLGASAPRRRMARRWARLSPADWVMDGLRNDFHNPAQTWALVRKP